MKKTGNSGVNWKVQGIFFLGSMALLFLILVIEPRYRGVVIWGGFFLTIAAILGIRLMRSPPGTPLRDALRPGPAGPVQKEPGESPAQSTAPPFNGEPVDPAAGTAKRHREKEQR